MEDKKAWVLDLESNDLLANMLDFSSFPYKLKLDAKLWCVVLTNIHTGEIRKAVKEEITKEWLKENLKGCQYLIGHNLIKFDAIVLMLFGVLDYRVGYLDEPDTLFGEEVKILDTLIMSRLLNPDRFGGHSLHSWGERTKTNKIDFRQLCIDKGYIKKIDPKGQEFKQYVPEMLEYCIGDTMTNKDTFISLVEEMGDYKGWQQALKLENKLADNAIRRESLGFWFDKDLAVKCVEELGGKMQDLTNKVNPLLPPKLMTKGELNTFTPPNTQFLKNGTPSTHITKFATRIGGFIEELKNNNELSEYYINFENNRFKLPYNMPLKTHTEADISNLDHVKMTLIELAWIPTEWAERDLTKDSKKISISHEKRITALERWYKETMEGKYKKLRLEIACETFKVKDPNDLLDTIKKKLDTDFPVRVPTSPRVRVGIEKDLCPNLIKLGEKVDFANDFALFLTYKHRKSSIAGGEIEDMDFDLETPNTGFLSMYREIDGRVATPAIEIGAASNRYRHIGIANIARASSVYGKEMRSLFGCGKEALQTAYDFSSLEARIQSHYCWKYTGGEDLSKELLASKPNDIHTLTGIRLGLDRDSAKSVNYMLVYGGKIPKVKKMLGVSDERATEVFNGFWDSLLALKELRIAVEKYWDSNGQNHVPGIDGRLIRTRSKHSLLNNIFQSGGIICAKYVNIFSMQYIEENGYNIDVFKDTPDVCEMIAYHDECQLYTKQSLIKFEMFKTEEETKKFILNWEGRGQLSAIGHGRVWYVCPPNVVSLAIEHGMRKTEKLLKLNVPLGYEWAVGRNWFECH